MADCCPDSRARRPRQRCSERLELSSCLRVPRTSLLPALTDTSHYHACLPSFSTVMGSRGSADTVRRRSWLCRQVPIPRKGNWDIVGNDVSSLLHPGCSQRIPRRYPLQARTSQKSLSWLRSQLLGFPMPSFEATHILGPSFQAFPTFVPHGARIQCQYLQVDQRQGRSHLVNSTPPHLGVAQSRRRTKHEASWPRPTISTARIFGRQLKASVPRWDRYPLIPQRSQADDFDPTLWMLPSSGPKKDFPV